MYGLLRFQLAKTFLFVGSTEIIPIIPNQNLFILTLLKILPTFIL